jgi:hypothetical protein
MLFTLYFNTFNKQSSTFRAQFTIMKLPYSLKEAENLCNEFQHLVGTSFQGGNSVIDSVVITPFDEASRQRFFLYYLLFDNDAKAALTQEYRGMLYDVVIIAHDIDGDMLHEDLHTWVERNNFNDDFPVILPTHKTNTSGSLFA